MSLYRTRPAASQALVAPLIRQQLQERGWENIKLDWCGDSLYVAAHLPGDSSGASARFALGPAALAALAQPQLALLAANALDAASDAA